MIAKNGPVQDKNNWPGSVAAHLAESLFGLIEQDQELKWNG